MIPFRSVKFRLTIWYALILTVFLSVFAFFMYAELSRVLYADADRRLRDEVRGLEESIRSYLDGIDLGVRLAGEPPFFAQPFGVSHEVRLRLIDAVESWKKGSQRLAKSTLSIRFVHLDSSVLTSNLQTWQNDIIFPDFERVSDFMEKGESLLTIHFQKQPIRLYYDLVRYKGRPLFIIQAMLPIHEVEKTLNRLAWIIWFSIPGAVVAACAAGWFLAKRSFQPVDLMIREARQITAAYLKKRLPRTHTRDEVDRLAETLNEMMDRIESSTRTIQDFSSDISHELKTPLAVIRGEIDLALRRARSEEDLKGTLGVIGEEVNELIRLVDDLMLLLKSDARQLQYEMSDVFLGELLVQVTQRFRERAEEKDINLRTEIGGDVLVWGDSVYLKRLFSNLLDNAIKFTQESGQVSVKLRVADKEAVAEIVDNGIGMDPSVLEKVFSRFYRADQARSQEGYGLGLNIAKVIADSHGASLEIRSFAGQGSTVTVKFPR